jgi:hypothetical protein
VNRRRANAVRAARGGFTLLEAIIALSLMTVVLIASLELRVQAMKVGGQVSSAARESRHIEALFTMVINRALPQPVRDEAAGTLTWSGTYLEARYVITRRSEEVDNPLRVLAAERSPQVTIWRYTIEYGGEQATFVWHR